MNNMESLQKVFEEDLREFVVENTNFDKLTNESKEFIKNERIEKVFGIFLDYRQRYPKGSKKVYFSKELLQNSLYQRFEENIKNIKDLFENGQDICPYLHKDIKNFLYQDGLLMDWGIMHIHLFPVEKREKGGLDKFILYAFVFEKSIGFIDIAEHDFLQKDILKTVDNNWPNILTTTTKLKGNNFERVQLKSLRSKGVGYALDLGNKMLYGGMPKVQRMITASYVFRNLDIVVKSAHDNVNSIRTAINSHIKNAAEIDIHLGFDSKNKMIVLYDKANNCGLNYQDIGLKNMSDCFNFHLLFET